MKINPLIKIFKKFYDLEPEQQKTWLQFENDNAAFMNEMLATKPMHYIIKDVTIVPYFMRFIGEFYNLYIYKDQVCILLEPKDIFSISESGFREVCQEFDRSGNVPRYVGKYGLAYKKPEEHWTKAYVQAYGEYLHMMIGKTLDEIDQEYGTDDK